MCISAGEGKDMRERLGIHIRWGIVIYVREYTTEMIVLRSSRNTFIKG